MPAMLFDVAILVGLYKNRSLRYTTGFPACKASDLKMIFVGLMAQAGLCRLNRLQLYFDEWLHDPE